MAPIETLSEHACFGGVQGFYRHASSVIGLPMRDCAGKKTEKCMGRPISLDGCE